MHNDCLARRVHRKIASARESSDQTIEVLHEFTRAHSAALTVSVITRVPEAARSLSTTHSSTVTVARKCPSGLTRIAFGWTGEMAIPLDILDFNAGVGTFGINFVRYQSRTKEWSAWANVTARNLPEGEEPRSRRDSSARRCCR